uniref:Rap-GAP domain-containing protein n=1 Tax=Elaeophora elaphi TaxID=1147741 RepID=A0A158Q7U7_9BILA
MPLSRRGFFSAIFSRKDSDDVQHFFNSFSEGSISQAAWLELGSGSSLSIRVKAMEQLESIVRSRRLQISTVEALYHETKDLFEMDETRDSFLKTFITLTEYQLDQLGLAMRDTFFSLIRSMGLTDLSLEWFVALSMNGDKVTGFEYDFMSLQLNWLREVLDLNIMDHRHAVRILQLTQQAIKTNAGFITNKEIDDVVHSICLRICRKADHLTYECLLLLGIILKYGRIPDTKLLILITTLCSVMNEEKWGTTAWSIMRDLLGSHYGYNVIKLMLDLLRDSANCPKTQVLVGAVYCIHTALWSQQHIDNLRCHPSVALPNMLPAMEVSPQVVNEVLIAIRRLLNASGKNLQQLSWHCILRLLKQALKLCQQVSWKGKVDQQRSRAHHLLSIIENLYHDGYYAGSPEVLYSLIESCIDERPVPSIISLFDYRVACLDPFISNWLHALQQLIQKHLQDNYPAAVREKAVSVLHTVYMKYHWLHERAVVTDFICPVLGGCIRENNAKIQYQMLNVLFDVARTVSLRESEDDDLFLMVMGIANSFLALDLDTGEILENMEIVASDVCQLLAERFSDLRSAHLYYIVHMLCEHLHSHYKHGFVREIGCEIRERIFSALLTLVCNPPSEEMVCIGEFGDVTNTRICRAGSDTNGDFEWSEICAVVTKAIEEELWFPIMKVILQRLCRIVEVRDLIFTAGAERMEKLKNSIIALYYKRSALISDADLAVTSLHKGEVDLPKYICPIFSRLINYYHDESICKIMVDCVSSLPSGCQQAIMACDLAVQVLPDGMAPLARQLISHLAGLYPSAVLAIPVIELASDCSSVPEFYQFFEIRHFQFVIDILAPYTSVHRYNTFIVAAAFRTLMRWYIKMPDAIKPTICNYIVKKIEEETKTLSTVTNAKEHSDEQHSSDFDTPTTATFSCCSANRKNGITNEDVLLRNELAEETIKALKTFMKHSKINDVAPTQSMPNAKLVERWSNHWVINDIVISVTSFTESPSTSTNKTMTTNVDEENPLVEMSDREISNFDRRRRHQSAIHRPNEIEAYSHFSRKYVAPYRPTLDDLCTVTKYESKKVLVPVVTWIQVVVRHIFGKHSWYMRSLKDFPDGFGSADNFCGIDEGLSILKLLASDNKAVQIPAGDKNKTLRSLRNIDRISSLELHTVGVVYIAHGQTKESEILGNIYGSARYASFLRLLGDPIPLEDCPGGLSAGFCGTFTYAYTDEISKTVFHVATLMPKSEIDPLCNCKKKFIGNDFVSVVFNDSGSPYVLGTISGKFAHVALEVVPQDNEHLLVTVHARKEIALWLAISRAFLPDQQAAVLIRKLILRAQLSVNVWRREEEEKGPPYIGLVVERLRAIRTLAANAAPIS